MRRLYLNVRSAEQAQKRLAPILDYDPPPLGRAAAE
jgi:hypothetical protein